MTELNPIKNTLEEMKKDLKSLLGIKRNKDPTTVTVSEKNPSSENKKQLLPKEEEKNKIIEINKIEKHTITNKRNDNFIDLTLDENNQPNLNNSFENELMNNFEDKYQNKNLKFDNINVINKIEAVESRDLNEEKIQEITNTKPEVTITATPYITKINDLINLEKNASPKHLVKEAAKMQENLEIKDKNEMNISLNINEIKSFKEDKLQQSSDKNNLNKDEDNKTPEKGVSEQQDIPSNQPIQTTHVEDTKTENLPKQTGFNLFTIENLSLPNKDKINEIFKAPQNNFFENLNMKAISFVGSNPSEKDEGKKDLSDKDKIKNDEAPKVQKIGFSLDMVCGLDNQKDQIMKNFSKQDNERNPFGLGFSSTNNNIFFTNNQFKNNLTSFENKPNLMMFGGDEIIDQKIEQVASPIISVTNQKMEEPIKQDKIQDDNQIINQSKNIQPDTAKIENIPTPHLPSSKIEENINKETLNPNIVPMDVEKDSKNIDTKGEDANKDSIKEESKPNNGVDLRQKVSAPIEKKIILGSKIDQIINKKLDQTAVNYNNNAKAAVELTTTQNKPENLIEKINNIENNISISNQNEIKKEITTVSTNKIEAEKTTYSINILNNINTNTISDQNTKTVGGLIEPQDQQVNEVLKKTIEPKDHQQVNEFLKNTIIEEKTITHPVPINPIIENKNESEIKKDEDKSQNQKNTSENKEMKTQLIPKANIPEKQIDSKPPMEAEKKDSTISVTSVFKDATNPENESNRAENQTAPAQNAPKQTPAPEPAKKRAITFQEAKEQIDKFSDLITNLEIEMRDKYGISIPQFYYEDLLPEPVKIKLVEEFFNDKDIVDLGKQLHQKLEEKK